MDSGKNKQKKREQRKQKAKMLNKPPRHKMIERPEKAK